MNAPASKATAMLNKQGEWYFERFKFSGTLFALAPSGEQYVVKRGDGYSAEFERLFDDMVNALAHPRINSQGL